MSPKPPLLYLGPLSGRIYGRAFGAVAEMARMELARRCEQV